MYPWYLGLGVGIFPILKIWEAGSKAMGTRIEFLGLRIYTSVGDVLTQLP